VKNSGNIDSKCTCLALEATYTSFHHGAILWPWQLRKPSSENLQPTEVSLALHAFGSKLFCKTQPILTASLTLVVVGNQAFGLGSYVEKLFDFGQITQLLWALIS
jgi:hypothetical protein